MAQGQPQIVENQTLHQLPGDDGEGFINGRLCPGSLCPSPRDMVYPVIVGFKGVNFRFVSSGQGMVMA
jgi:hypothetical protein